MFNTLERHLILFPTNLSESTGNIEFGIHSAEFDFDIPPSDSEDTIDLILEGVVMSFMREKLEPAQRDVDKARRRFAAELLLIIDKLRFEALIEDASGTAVLYPPAFFAPQEFMDYTYQHKLHYRHDPRYVTDFIYEQLKTRQVAAE